MTLPRRNEPIHALLIDLDGVIYIGETPIPGAVEFVANLQRHAVPFLFLSNNPTLTPTQYAGKLARMGVQVTPAHFWTSALATAAWLRTQAPAGSPVLVIGEDGLRAALVDDGMRLVDDWRAAAWVVVSLDRQVTWRALADAALAIQRGARFLATNADLTLPAEEGALPGGGALVNLLHVTTGVVPLVIGKPQRTMFDQALQHLNSHAANTVMVGDRYETDIIGAQRAGLRTVAVLTGVTQATELAVCDPPPDWIIPSIAEMGTLIWEVDNAV
jgi:4-nitrophenyl phosphatase